MGVESCSGVACEAFIDLVELVLFFTLWKNSLHSLLSSHLPHEIRSISVYPMCCQACHKDPGLINDVSDEIDWECYEPRFQYRERLLTWRS